MATPVLTACEAPAAPLLVEGAERFEPPPVYRLWWAATQECSGRRGVFSTVQWYVVPGARTLLVDGRRVQGYWTSPGNAIVLAEAAALDGALVRHEMLHSLDRGAGHPRESFVDRCGGVVVCDGQCATDTGPPGSGNPAAARVEPDALVVDVVVTPTSPSRGQYDGRFVMTVTARNPLGYPVVVSLPPPADAGPSVTFEYRIEYPSGVITLNDRFRDASVIRFAPGETKRRVYDFYMTDAAGTTGGGGLGPGTYELRGAYGAQWAPQTRIITLAP